MIPTHTPDELKQIAVDLRAGRIFTDRHVKGPEEMSMVFMVLLFLDEKALAELKANPPGMVYEYLSEAGPRSINGMPCFMSHRYLTLEDTKTVFDLMKKLEAAEKAVLGAA